MTPNRIKRVMREGGIALGTYTGGIADPQVIEIIGMAGFDACFIDLEHTALDLHDVQAMVVSAERVGISTLVRTPLFDPALVLQLLDIGVHGVQLPHIDTPELAREAVKAVRYPPLGQRGVSSGCRAAGFGSIPIREHIEQSNREVLLSVMVEDLEGIRNIGEIAQVEGIDIISIGPTDLSSALGLSGQPDHPKLVETIGTAAKAIREVGKARLALPMNHRSFPLNAAQLLELGVGYSNCAPGPEPRLLKSWKDQLQEARSTLGKQKI